MTHAAHSEYDDYRPPEPARGGRRRRRGTGRRRAEGAGGGEGAREMSMVADVEFENYYGRAVVKAPPWEWPIGLYLFVGGLAGGSSVLAGGAALTDRPLLRRNARFVALGAVSAGLPALVLDLGRPERFLHMLRVFKPTSPMSVGTWLLSGFGLSAGLAAAGELDRMTGGRIAPRALRPVLRALEGAGAVGAAALGGPLAAYTAALLGDTAVPTWAATRKSLAYVFVSSATMASTGAAMVLTPTRETGPARVLAAAGVLGDVVGMHVMKDQMHELEAEPLETGRPGRMLKLSEGLAVTGGVAALLGGRSRPLAVLSGLALLGASALTRFGVLEAGLESVKDPRRVVEPQRERLERRRAAGIVGDSITTAPVAGTRPGEDPEQTGPGPQRPEATEPGSVDAGETGRGTL